MTLTHFRESFATFVLRKFPSEAFLQEIGNESQFAKMAHTPRLYLAVNGNPNPVSLVLTQNNKLGISPFALAVRTFSKNECDNSMCIRALNMRLSGQSYHPLTIVSENAEIFLIE